MLLITVNEWLASKKSAARGDVDRVILDRPTAFASKLPLEPALKELERYRLAYLTRYRLMALEFRLISVSQVDALDPDVLFPFGCEMIESLIESRVLWAGGETPRAGGGS